MVTVLAGENSFLLQHDLRRIIADFVAEHTDMALEQIDGEEAEFDRMHEALQSMPFLASKKLVVLRKPSANKQFVEAAESLLSDLPETTDVLIIEPKLDKRLSYYKYLKKHTEYTEYIEMDTSGLARWLVTEAKAQGGNIKQTDAIYLVERTGTNQQLLSNELAKLLLYNDEITRGSIDLLTERTPQSSTFDLLDAALSGQYEKAMRLYQEQRAMKVEPQQIMGLLGWQLHIMAIVKTAGQRDPADIARSAKLNPFVVRKSQGLVRNMTLPELKSLIARVARLDVRLKSESIDADEAFQNLLLSFK